MDVAFSGALVLALIYSIVNTMKYAVNEAWTSVITQAIVWMASFLVIALVASTRWGEEFEVMGATVASANIAELIFLSLAIGSSASVVNDFRKSLDGTDSGHVPSLWESKVLHDSRAAEDHVASIMSPITPTPQDMSAMASTIPHETGGTVHVQHRGPVLDDDDDVSSPAGHVNVVPYDDEDDEENPFA